MRQAAEELMKVERDVAYRKPIGTKFVHLPATFVRPVHYPGNTSPKSRPAMKQILPVLCALIPFAAMIGACVTCP